MARQGSASLRRATILPDNSRCNGLTGMTIPDHGGLALIGQANCSDPARFHTTGDQCGGYGGGHGIDQVRGCLLDPSALGIGQFDFHLTGSKGIGMLVKNDGTGAGGALIDHQQAVGRIGFGHGLNGSREEFDRFLGNG